MEREFKESSFGRELRGLRRSLGKTLEDIGNVWGVSIPHVSDIERGRRSPPNRAAIAKILQEFGQLDQLDHFVSLALAYRGEFQRQIKNDQEKRVLVALERAFDDELTSDDYERILKMLSGIKEKSNG